MSLRHAMQPTLDCPMDYPERATGKGLLIQARWLDALCILLLGYALFGKGFAYLGVGPLFVGELVLISGVLLFLRYGSWSYVAVYPPAWTLLILAMWGAVTTLPHISVYGMDSLRDAMIWGYAAFAFLVAGMLMADPTRLAVLINRYQLFIPIFLLAVPFTYVISELGLVPNWPWADVAMIEVKVGDVMVHLAGVFAFWASGLGRRIGKLWVAILLACVAVLGVASRGGLVAFLVSYAICFLYRPLNRLLWSVIAVGTCGILLLAVSGLSFEVPGKDREFSAEQIVEGVVSVFDNSQDRSLDSTKQWRLNWWADIIDYTWRGVYFWTGKGFGINLADSDGYQGTQWEGLLRSPHNGHMTMLARAGVPGFVFWLVPQFLWLILMVRSSLRSLVNGDSKWTSLHIFLIAYWAAFIVRATFDVYLEGPMGGIWFWTIFGIGLSCMVIYQYSPDALIEQGSEIENSPSA